MAFLKNLLTTTRFVRLVSSKPSVVGHFRTLPPLSDVRVGQQLVAPFELTVTDALAVQWQSSFFSQDRINCSKVFAQSIGLQTTLMPYSLVHALCSSMSHVDESQEVMELANRNAVYIEPVYEGDTLRKVFHIRGMRAARDNQATVITVKCDLYNQHEKKVFELDKLMLFPQQTRPDTHVRPPSHPPAAPVSNLLVRVTWGVSSQNIAHHGKSTNEASPLSAAVASAHTKLVPTKLILHQMSRMIGQSAAFGLSTMLRLTHPLHYNTLRYHPEQLAVSGSLVLAATLANAASDLFEVLHETVSAVSFPNKVKPSDVLGAMTYILSKRSLDTGGVNSLEEVTVCTVGFKNIDVQLLNGVELPETLFQSGTDLKQAEVEKLCENKMQMLCGKIVCIAVRTLIRQAPTNYQSFLL